MRNDQHNQVYSTAATQLKRCEMQTCAMSVYGPSTTMPFKSHGKVSFPTRQFFEMQVSCKGKEGQRGSDGTIDCQRAKLGKQMITIQNCPTSPSTDANYLDTLSQFKAVPFWKGTTAAPRPEQEP